MLDLNQYRGTNGSVHFIGCGGVGTQPLMHIFHTMGFRVSGSDLLENQGIRELRSLGLTVHIGHHPDHLPPDDGSRLLVIHTSAAASDNPELVEAKRRGAICIRRGEALGLMTSVFQRVISVSGSHGKTSITAMLAAALRELHAEPGYLVGGMVQTWDHNGEAGSGDLFVTEVDESDGTHAVMKSTIGVVPNVEDDHAWSVGGVDALMNNFRHYAENATHLIYVSSPVTDALFAEHPSRTALSPDPAASSHALDAFDPQVIARWGRYQKINALTALAVLEHLGFEHNAAARALSRFPGVERRMSLRFDSPERRVIEDYAHHPTELSASIEALRETNKGRRLVIIFQPHRYARLERYFDAFAKELSKGDRVFITPVFAAWTSGGKKNAADLEKAIGDRASCLSGSWAEMAATVEQGLQPGDLVAVIGAGDLKEILPFLCRKP